MMKITQLKQNNTIITDAITEIIQLQKNNVIANAITLVIM